MAPQGAAPSKLQTGQTHSLSHTALSQMKGGKVIAMRMEFTVSAKIKHDHNPAV